MTFPYVDDTATKHLVTLNSNTYVTYSGVDVQEQPASEFAVQVAQGPPSQDTREGLSYWTMSNWTPGLGKNHGDFREDAGRFWDSTLDTRIAGQLTLGPLIQTLGTAQTLGVSGSGRDSFFAFFKNNLYLGCGDKVFQYAAGVWGEVLDTGTDIVTGLVTFLSTSGTHRIYAFTDSSRFWYSTTGAAAAWTQSDAGVIAYSGLSYQGHLILFGGVTNEGQVSWSTAADADGVAASYTTLTQVPATASSHMRGVIFRDPDGEQTPYFALLDLQGECAVFVLHPYRLNADAIDVAFLREDTYFPGQPGLVGLVRWGDKLYIPSRQAVYAYEPGSARDIGPLAEGGQGLPSGMDHVGGFVPGRDNLFAIVGQSTIRIASYTGIGWHFLASPNGLPTGMYLDGSSGRARLYWAETQTAPNQVTVRFFHAIEQVNPVNFSSYTYASTGYLITPWVDGGFADLDKLLLKMRIQADNLSDLTANPATGAEVTIAYQLETGTDSGTWTNLGAFKANTDVLQFASGAGVECRRWRFRITLDRGTTNTVSPVVRALTLDYLVTPDYRAANSFWIDFGKTLRYRQNTGSPTTIAGLQAELEATYELATLPNYQWDQDTARRVKLVSYKTSFWDLDMPDPETGSTRDALSQVQVVQVIA